MKIQIKDSSSNGVIFVRRISWQKRCEEQLDKIIKELKETRNNLQTTKNKLEAMIYEQN